MTDRTTEDTIVKTSRIYGGALAADALTRSFTTHEDWQRFYDVHMGPLLFAKETLGYKDAQLTAFVSTFLVALDARRPNLPILPRNRNKTEAAAVTTELTENKVERALAAIDAAARSPGIKPTDEDEAWFRDHARLSHPHAGGVPFGWETAGGPTDQELPCLASPPGEEENCPHCNAAPGEACKLEAEWTARDEEDARKLEAMGEGVPLTSLQTAKAIAESFAALSSAHERLGYRPDSAGESQIPWAGP